MDMMQFALQMIQRNPNVANNPRARDMINVLQSGDQQKGIELANNLCKTYGTSPQDAVNQARQFFGIR